MLNAIIYFCNNTKWCMKTKLFKLLFLLDFSHFKETGKSVTGLEYSAWDMGPVPENLFSELKNPNEDFSEKIQIEIDPIDNGCSITAKVEFDSKIFSRRELRILHDLSEEYKNAKSAELILETHKEGTPWDETFKTKGRNAIINYFLILKSEGAISEEEAQFVADEIEDSKKFMQSLVA